METNQDKIEYPVTVTVVESKPISDRPKQNRFSRVLEGFAIGTAILGGGILSLIFFVLRFVYIAAVGFSAIWSAIVLFASGHIVWGFVVLFVGTPLAIGLASVFFLPLFVFTIAALVVWGGASLFGSTLSFSDIYDLLWFIGKIAIIASLVFYGAYEFIKDIRSNGFVSAFKKNRSGILGQIVLVGFLAWAFF